MPAGRLRLRDDREPRRDAGDARACRPPSSPAARSSAASAAAGTCHPARWDPFLAAEDADQPVDAVVVRRTSSYAIGQSSPRPSRSCRGSRRARSGARCVPSGSCARPASAPRHQSNFVPGARVYGSPVDLPATDAGVELAERPRRRGRARAAAWRTAIQHRASSRRPMPARLEHHDSGAGLCQRVGRHAAAGARADDADVVRGGLSSCQHSRVAPG